MVETKKMTLDVEIEIDIPIDIIQDRGRIKAVEDGLGRSISKGLYDQGVSFQIKKISSQIKWMWMILADSLELSLCSTDDVE